MAIVTTESRGRGERRRSPPVAFSPPPAAPPRLMAFCGLLLGIACLYWARPVFVPVALALLLAFLLNPVVVLARRTGLRRVPAVTVVVLVAFLAAAGLGWALFHQITGLADDLPRYRQTISRKIADVQRVRRGGTLEKVEVTAADVMKQLEKADRTKPAEPKPIPVEIAGPSPLWRLPDAFKVLGSAALVIVLLLFMLIQRRELLARIARIFGEDRLAVTTRALDEAGTRISQYLLMQSAINGGFGLVVGVGLVALGMPFALVWGFFAATLRFIPYAGVWLAALVPMVLSLAIFEGWMKPLMVLGLYVVGEVIVSFFLEPLLYRRSAGVSALALLVAAAFWTWLWGPIGLLLAIPLTVCLVVLARAISGLEFIAFLMSDDSGVPRDVIYYQRLVAGDEAEAGELVAEAVKSGSVEAAFDGILIPALVRARRDHEAGRLTGEEYGRILSATAELVERLGAPPDMAEPAAPATGGAIIAACPASDEADRVALAMLRHLLGPAGDAAHTAPAGGLVSEMLAFVHETRPSLICVGSVGAGRLGRTRHLVKRLRADCPEVPILVGRWGAPRGRGDRIDLYAAGAADVATSLAEARAEVMRLTSGEPSRA